VTHDEGAQPTPTSGSSMGDIRSLRAIDETHRLARPSLSPRRALAPGSLWLETANVLVAPPPPLTLSMPPARPSRLASEVAQFGAQAVEIARAPVD